MSDYPKENRGTIAKNQRKTEDNHPDIAGSINVEGRDYWINGWQKQNRNDGSTFYSLTVKPKEQKRPAGSKPRHDPDDPRTSYGDRASDLDEAEIPF